MNWGAVGTLVGVVGVAFAAGVWVNSADSNLDELTQRLEALESKPPPTIPPSTPQSQIALFDLGSCPSGWKEKESVRGRYLVGMVLGGKPGSSIGTALSLNENRPAGPHSHAYSDDSVGYKVSAGRYEGLRTEFRGDSSVSLYHRQGTTTVSVSPAAPGGTNAPYIQFLACEKL